MRFACGTEAPFLRKIWIILEFGYSSVCPLSPEYNPDRLEKDRDIKP